MILYHGLIYLKCHFTAFLHDFIIRLVVLDPYTATEDAAQRPCQTQCLAFSPLMIWVENWPMDFWISHDFPLTSRKKRSWKKIAPPAPEIPNWCCQPCGYQTSTSLRRTENDAGNQMENCTRRPLVITKVPSTCQKKVQRCCYIINRIEV
jgi:hypothetical protein